MINRETRYLFVLLITILFPMPILAWDTSPTKSITVEVGQVFELSISSIDSHAEYYIRQSNFKPSRTGGITNWYCLGSSSGGMVKILDEQRISIDNGYGKRWYSPSIKVIATEAGKASMHVYIHSTKSATQSMLETIYTDVECVFEITIQDTGKPQLTFEANDSSKRVVKNTAIRFTPSFPNATIYVRDFSKEYIKYNEVTAGSVQLSTIGTTKIRAFANKKGYPTSKELDFEYEVIQPGDFNVTTPEGINMHFNILSETTKECGLYYVAENMKGDCVIPNNVNGYSVVRIFDKACMRCSQLTNVRIPEGVTSIGKYAFYYTKNINSIIIPSTAKTIGDHAFMYSGLTSLILEEGVQSIGWWAFGATDLVNVTLPKSLKEIEHSAFRGNPNLRSITSMIEEPYPLHVTIFAVDNSGLDTASTEAWTSSSLYVPKGCKEKYLSTDGWWLFKNIVELGDEPEPFSSVQGDMNGDGIVNGTDLVALVNIILGKQAETDAADVNGDGNVNGTDIVTLCNIILGRASAPK